MESFPIIRKKWSNEHVMTLVFLILLLYMLPEFIENPGLFLNFLIVLAVSLFIDAAINIIRFKRPVCAVSAGVTAGVLQVLTPGVPLYGKLLGALAAIIIGKHLWGGTGKNAINPAVTGLLVISFFFKIKFPIFSPSLLLVPGMLLSIPFVRYRPYASIGFAAGMLSVLFFKQELTLSAFSSYGIILWSCLVMTDPATVTLNPIVGIIGGFLAGFIPLQLFNNVISTALAVIIFNLISYVCDKMTALDAFIIPSRLRIKRLVEFMGEKDFTDKVYKQEFVQLKEMDTLSRDEIIKRITQNGIFGCGGSAFPAYRKINAVIQSKALEKHLIINGVECDPGLIHDKWLMKNYPEEILCGIELLKRCVEFKSVTLAVKGGRGISSLRNLKVYKVLDYYPAGAEKELIKRILGKNLAHNIITPIEGILVFNVQTVYSIYEAVIKNKKADSKFITVANLNKKTGIVIRTKLGVKVYDIIRDLYKQNGLVYCGGGAMESHEAAEEEIVDKQTNFIAITNYPDYKESPQCSGCGACILICPSGLRINKISELIENEDLKGTKRYSPEKCISCGSCSYVCPAGKKLSIQMRRAREFARN